MPQNTRRYFEEAGQSSEGLSPNHPEFAALMRSKVGSQYQHLVAPERLGLAALIGDPKKLPYDMRGLNMEQVYPSSIKNRIKEKIELDANQKLDYQKIGAKSPFPWFEAITGINASGKKLFGFGRGADADVWAHEFRHGDPEQTGEYNNRFEDFANSTSIPNYRNKMNNFVNSFFNASAFKKGEKPSIKEREALALDTFKYNIDRRVEEIIQKLGIPRKVGDSEDFLAKNIELNRAGAVGAFDASGKKLDPLFIKARAEMPFLNFVGRLEDPTPKKKADGGMIENTTHDRKIL
jgi:hypothetical protein